MLGVQRHPISWYSCMDIYVHKSSSNYDAVALGAPFGVATASAIRDAVTYKAVDIPKLKIISFILWHYVLCINYSLCSLQANIRSTTVYLYSLSCTVCITRPSFCLSILRLLLFGCSRHPPVALHAMYYTRTVFLSTDTLIL